MDHKKTSKETESKLNNPFMPDENLVGKMMEMPNQVTQIMLDTTRKSQEAAVAYVRQVEQIQRDHFQAMTQVWGAVLPGESKLWENQIKLVESGFELFDKMMSAGKKAA